MGTYHLIANHTKKEWIDLFKLNIGVRDFVYPQAAHLIAWLMMWTDWNHDHIDIVPDSVPLYDEIEKTYKDMTLELVGKYNEWISDKPELQLEFDDDE